MDTLFKFQIFVNNDWFVSYKNPNIMLMRK
jgi:hypothetical protein